MTKEQFLKMKSDFKVAIAETKYDNKFCNKAWYNLGYKSEEDFNKLRDEEWEKLNKLKCNILKDDKWKIPYLYGCDFISHWAYYCAKHQLNSEQRSEYIKNEIKKMKEEKRNQYEYLLDLSNNVKTGVIKKVEDIITAYEKVVCTN